MGELAGLCAAFIWSATNVILRGQSVRLGAVTVNAWRSVFAAIFFAMIFFLTRGPSYITAIPLQSLVILLLGVILGMVIGDTMQFFAMGRIGVSRAMPISSCFPLFTIGIAAAFLGEQITIQTIGGTVLVLLGVVMVALPRRAGIEETSTHEALPAGYWIGVAAALTAAVCWSLSTTTARFAMQNIDVITANTVRIPFSAFVSFLIGSRTGMVSPKKFGRQSLAIIFSCGIVGTAGGGFLYLTAISLAGAAKTAILGSAAPVFGLIISVIFLGERPSPRGILGTFLSVAGIVLVSIK